MRASYPELDAAVRPHQGRCGRRGGGVPAHPHPGHHDLRDCGRGDAKSAGGRVLGGEEAFALHDTYGFPIDLTLEMAAEQGLTVDEAAFRSLMQEQRDRARADAKAKKGAHGDFGAYQEIAAHDAFGVPRLRRAAGAVQGGRARSRTASASPRHRPASRSRSSWRRRRSTRNRVVRTRTPARFADPTPRLRCMDVQRPVKDVIVHSVKVEEGTIAVGDVVSAEVDPREPPLGLEGALRHAPDPLRASRGAGQAGEPGWLLQQARLHAPRLLVDAGRLAVPPAARSRTSPTTRSARNCPSTTNVMSLDEAKALGAMALFGEKYGDRVRVVEIGGPFSRELCAGTHVDNSSQIGLLTVTGEGSVGSGARRIEALVGADAFSHLAAERAIVSELTSSLKTQPHELTGRVDSLVERLCARGEGAGRLAPAGAARRCGAISPATPASMGGVRWWPASRGRRLERRRPARARDRRAIPARRQSLRQWSRLAADLDGKPSIVVATNGPRATLGLRAGDLVKTGLDGAWRRRRRQARPRSGRRPRRRRAIPAARSGAISAAVGERG